ncbi:hypothetical protein CRV24_000436 [Beauveria bassiana]|nr:hypothetical protein CRV24_000436 [Beauveria bassiana]
MLHHGLQSFFFRRQVFHQRYLLRSRGCVVVREFPVSLNSGQVLFLAGTQEIEPDLVAKIGSSLFLRDNFVLSVLLVGLKTLYTKRMLGFCLLQSVEPLKRLLLFTPQSLLVSTALVKHVHVFRRCKIVNGNAEILAEEGKEC